jgi:tRNA dimethylallyltransferase
MLLIISGPTASGKTHLAEIIARTLNGEIVSADSRTLYRDLKIGTGGFSNSSDIPYHLTEIIDIGSAFSSYDWVMGARSAIKDIVNRKKTPIICGGTVHYIEMLLKGINSVPKPDLQLREDLKDTAQRKGRPYVHDMLKDIDHELAGNVHPNNLERTIRYIERIQGTEMIPSVEPYHDEYSLCFLDHDRKKIYSDIETRVRKMIEMGWVDEVRDLIKKGYSSKDPGLDSIGYREIISFIEGKISMERSEEIIVRKTKEYSRKQIKFLKRFGPDVSLISSNTDVEQIIRSIS